MSGKCLLDKYDKKLLGFWFIFKNDFANMLTKVDIDFLLFFFQRYLKEPDSQGHCDLFDLIEKMLIYEPDKRCTLKQAMRHPFLNQFYARDRSSSLLYERSNSNGLVPHS